MIVLPIAQFQSVVTGFGAHVPRQATTWREMLKNFLMLLDMS
jgi:hypothetical protein